jgi:hypothetical protein
MEFMDLRDIANMMGVNNMSMCMIKQETQPIAILAMLPTVGQFLPVLYPSSIIEGVVQHHDGNRRVSFFVPQRTRVTTFIALINRYYPPKYPDEYECLVPTGLAHPAWSPLAWRTLHGPVSALPRHSLMVKHSPFCWDRGWRPERWQEVRLRWAMEDWREDNPNPVWW